MGFRPAAQCRRFREVCRIPFMLAWPPVLTWFGAMDLHEQQSVSKTMTWQNVTQGSPGNPEALAMHAVCTCSSTPSRDSRQAAEFRSPVSLDRLVARENRKKRRYDISSLLMTYHSPFGASTRYSSEKGGCVLPECRSSSTFSKWTVYAADFEIEKCSTCLNPHLEFEPHSQDIALGDLGRTQKYCL